jgi:GntR family transcriptional repressor for pyruvate dehydrogenase complex
MSRTTRRQSRTQFVVEALIKKIQSGNLNTGDQFPTEPEISETLNVSRSSVREAMKILEIINLVEIRHGTGTFVKSIYPSLLINPSDIGYSANREHLIQLIELRKIIETESAGLAAERATPEEIGILHKDVIALKKGVAENIRPDEDLGFHLDISKATHNRSIMDVSHWITTFYMIENEVPTIKDIEAHQRIYEAILHRDPNAARAEMRSHLEEVESHYKNG